MESPSGRSNANGTSSGSSSAADQAMEHYRSGPWASFPPPKVPQCPYEPVPIFLYGGALTEAHRLQRILRLEKLPHLRHAQIRHYQEIPYGPGMEHTALMWAGCGTGALVEGRVFLIKSAEQEVLLEYYHQGLYVMKDVQFRVKGKGMVDGVTFVWDGDREELEVVRFGNRDTGPLMGRFSEESEVELNPSAGILEMVLARVEERVRRQKEKEDALGGSEETSGRHLEAVETLASLGSTG